MSRVDEHKSISDLAKTTDSATVTSPTITCCKYCGSKSPSSPNFCKMAQTDIMGFLSKEEQKEQDEHFQLHQSSYKAEPATAPSLSLYEYVAGKPPITCCKYCGSDDENAPDYCDVAEQDIMGYLSKEEQGEVDKWLEEKHKLETFKI